MGKTAWVFPGQGAQTVGMGKDAWTDVEAAKRLYEAADSAVGFELSRIAFEGPEAELKMTANTQPALLTTSLAYLHAFKAAGGADARPDYVAGHSLGEWTALAAAGALEASEAARLVHMRGRFMEEAVPGGRGAMAAVLGAERETLGELCRAVSAETGLVELANLNCPGQIVVSGTREGVEALAARGKEAGAKRVIPLEVSGPFHSSLMRPASERLGELLGSAAVGAPSVPLIANVTAEVTGDASEIRGLLVRQVYSPVLWEDSVMKMIELGVDTFVEFGPGSVLAGLIKKISKDVRTISVNSVEAAREAVPALL
ncbi:ACP S-malonyltransferase [Paenibacillus thermotolerans]|uniref:ACP S-malonyltransferase n=1 Tax=Paenibacillus thermotolerans TaxID=3027807 RepID=UPI0023674555|nr:MULTISPECIES: ACP S-malonyltransferase [unclassified Paenibacillus]